jgi:hypothetical protein
MGWSRACSHVRARKAPREEAEEVAAAEVVVVGVFSSCRAVLSQRPQMS